MRYMKEIVTGVLAFLIVGGVITALVIEPCDRPVSVDIPVATHGQRLEPTLGQRGNTTGNVANGGFVVTDGEWIFYSIFDVVGEPNEYYGQIVRVRADRTGREVIWREKLDVAMFLAVVENWLYFSSSNGIFRMRIDGTQMENIDPTFAVRMDIVGEWIYFADIERNAYRISTNGSQREEVDIQAVRFFIIEDWLIYLDSTDLSINRVRRDGTEHIRLSDGLSSLFDVYDGWIYFSQASGGSVNIYKIRLDGTEHHQIIDEPGFFGNIYDGWIFYSHYHSDGRIYRSSLDGAVRKRISEYPGHHINIVDGWIYYSAANVWRADPSMFATVPMYRMRLDGSGNERVN